MPHVLPAGEKRPKIDRDRNGEHRSGRSGARLELSPIEGGINHFMDRDPVGAADLPQASQAFRSYAMRGESRYPERLGREIDPRVREGEMNEAPQQPSEAGLEQHLALPWPCRLEGRNIRRDWHPAPGRCCLRRLDIVEKPRRVGDFVGQFRALVSPLIPGRSKHGPGGLLKHRGEPPSRL